MNWFQAHAYVATWCSPLIALVGLLIRAPRNKATGEVEWLSIILYVVLLSVTAAALSPDVDKGTALFARGSWLFLVIFISMREAQMRR